MIQNQMTMDPLAGDALSAYVPPAGLATAANLNRGWVTKAAQLGLVNLSTLDGEDLIVVRVFAFVDQLVWPGERRSRSVSRSMEPWQSLAVNAAREAARDSATNLESMLWITSEGVAVTHSAGAHASYVVDAGTGRSVFVGVPIGEWVAELPPHLETIFHWPEQLMSVELTLKDGSRLDLAAYNTIPEQMTVFAACSGGLNPSSLEAVKAHVRSQYPDFSVRVVERQLEGGAPTKSYWHELYERPAGGLVKRPISYEALLSEYGPQLNRLGLKAGDASMRRRSSR